MPKLGILIATSEYGLGVRLQTVLQNLGYAVAAIVSTGEEAVARATSSTPDLILLDLRLAGTMNALTTASYLRASGAFPIVYLVAQAERVLLANAQATNPYGYVFPPFDAHTLNATLAMAWEHHRLEMQLREKEARYRSVIEQASDGILLLEPQTFRVFDANPAFQRLVGYTAAELETLSPWDWIFEGAARIAPEIRRALDQQPVVAQELRLRHKNGAPLDVELGVHRITVNKQPMLSLVVHDLSERRRLEHLRKLQHKFGVAVGATSDLDYALNLVLGLAFQIEGVDAGGIYLLDQRTGMLDLVLHRGLPQEFVETVTHLNPESPQAQLVQAGAPVYTRFAEIALPKLDAHVREGLRAFATIPVMYQGKAIAALNLASHTLDEIPFLARVLLEGVAAELGSVLMRLRYEANLREHRRNLQALFDTLDDFLFVLDEQGRVVQTNPVVEKRLGYTAAEIAQMTVLDFHPPAQREQAAAIVAAMLAGTRYSCPIPLQTKTGALIPVETRVVRGEWNQRPVLFGISRDVTERRRAEDLVQIQRDLGVALSATSDLPRALELILDAACQIEGIDAGGIYLCDPQTGALELKSHRGLPQTFIARAAHYAADAPHTQLARAGNPLYTQYARVDLPDKADPTQREGLRALAVLPVLHDHQLIAVLNLASHLHDDIPLYARAALESIAFQIGSVFGRLQAEAALRESQQNLQTLFDTLTDFLFVLDEHGNVIKTNPVVAARLGYTPEHVAQMNVLDFHPPARRAEAAQIVAEMLAGDRQLCPVPLLTQDGALIPVETRVVRGRWGNRPALFGISRDLTERQQAEAALHASEERFRTLVASMDDVIFTLDYDERHTGVYGKWIERAGLTPEFFLGKTASEIFGAVAGAPHHAAAVRALAGANVVYEWTLDGGQGARYFQTMLSPLRDDHGEVVGLVGVGRDLTERKRSEDALRESEARFRRLADTAPVLIWMADANRNTIYVNQPWLDFTENGLPLDPVSDWVANAHPDDSLRCADAYARAYQAHASFEIEFRLRHYTGAYRWVLNTGVPRYTPEGIFLGFIGSCVDITDRHDAEAASRESEQRFRTVADFTHDWVYWRGADRSLIYISPSCEKITGYAPQEFYADPTLLERIVHPDDHARFVAHVHDPASTTVEFRIVRGDGATRWIDHVCRTVTAEDGAYLGRRVSNRDVTERKQMEEELRAQEHYLALLNNITRAAIETHSFPAMAQILADRVGELFGADGCYITAWDDEKQMAIPVAAYGAMHDTYAQVPPQPGVSMTRSVLDAVQPLVAEDVFHSPFIAPQIAARFPTRSMLGLPLIADGVKLGAVLVSFSAPHQFTPAEIARGEQAAGQIAVAVAKARLFDAERRHTENLSHTNTLITVLTHVATRIEAAPDAERAMQTLGTELEPHGIRCVIALCTPDGVHLGLRYTSIPPALLTQLEQQMHTTFQDFRIVAKQLPVYTDLFEARRNVFTADATLMLRALLPDLPADLVHEATRASGVTEQTRHIYLPLIANDKPIGMMTLWGDDLRAEDLPTFSIFAAQVAITLEKARLYAQVAQLAITDDLTGLLNYRGFTQCGQRELERARRYKHPLTVILLDIDHFKDVNDQYGHPIGNQVLCALAERCRQNMREVDLFGRYGGEEFVLLLPESDLTTARTAAERLRRIVADTPVPTSAGAVPITISLGITELRAEQVELVALLGVADKAMYLAKQAGRNCIVAQ